VTEIGRRVRISTAVAFLLSSLVVAAASSGAPEGEPTLTSAPDATVNDLHEALLGVMKNAHELGYEGRFNRLYPLLPQLFDLPFMAQKSIGRYWKTTNEQERAQLLETFTRFTTANYAGNFDDYSGQSFETLGTEESTHGTMLVRSQLTDPAGENIQLNYRLRPVDGHWKIIDIYLNGTVSELALRRSEYSSLIERKGFHALIAALDDKISELSTSAPAAQSP
jgi:phospholipid transport system substrate-binding protein